MKKMSILLLVVLIHGCVVNKPLGVYYNACPSRFGVQYIVLKKDSFFYTYLERDTIKGTWKQEGNKLRLYSDSFWPISTIKDYNYYFAKYRNDIIALDSTLASPRTTIKYQLSFNDSMDVFIVRKKELVIFSEKNKSKQRCTFKKEK